MLRSRVQMLEVEVADKKATIAKLRAALAKQSEREKEIEARPSQILPHAVLFWQHLTCFRLYRDRFLGSTKSSR